AAITPPPGPNGLLFYDLHDWSFEKDTDQKWTYTPTDALYGSETQQYDRNKSFKWATLSTSWGGREAITDNVIAGLVSNSSHTASVQWMTSSVEFTEPKARIIIEWYDSSNSLISKSTSTEFSLGSRNTWHNMISTFTSPANNRKAKMIFQAKKITSSSSTVVYFDAAGFWSEEWDETDPGAISNLTALSQGTNLSGDITLEWTAPGSDGTGREDLYAYEVKYATRYIGEDDYGASWTSVYSQNWTPANFGSAESHILTGFAEGATYFFAVKGYDERNWGVWPGTSSAVNSLSFGLASSSAPSQVNDFDAVTGSGSGEIDLSWTTPGDDGTTGDLTAGSKFLIKYSSVSSQLWDTMDYNWYVSTAVAQGTVSAHTVTGLANHTTYYFYIKTSDEAGNWSPLSN
ncbi:MAG: fibronectin type III domain-containing protein, partial [Elusimicrobia bacterium]|nr:fibronectin type III domain-containing protein [Elusimicrobiota bacterium]